MNIVFSPDLNAVELCCSLIGILLSVLLLYLRKRPRGELVLTGIAITPATLLAATAFSRFLSWDESYIFYDIVHFYGGRLPQWELGAFRTSITFFGPLSAALQALSPLTKDVVLVLMKAAHWVAGLAIINVVCDQVHRYFYPNVQQGIFHGIVYNAILLLPVTGLALKTLSYDLFSLTLGVLGCVWCLAGLWPLRKPLLIAGVVTLTLAAHEKLIASPLLWIALVVVTVRLALAIPLPPKKLFVVITLRAIMVTLVSVGTVAGSFIFVYLTHGPDAPLFNADQMFLCWVSSLWPLTRLFGIACSVTTVHRTLMQELPGIFGRTAVVAGVVAVVSGIVCYAYRFVTQRKQESLPRVVDHTLSYLPVTLVTAITVTGIAAQYILKTRIWPIVPVRDGAYIPRMTFNGIAHHFGAQSLVTHTLASTAWACAVFVNALPTAVLLLLFTAGIVRLRTGCASVPPHQRGMDILALFFLIVPFVFGALQIPLYPRYFNLFLTGTVVTVIPGLFSVGSFRVTRTNGIVGGLLLLFACAEVVPFQPLGATFRPVWSNYSKKSNNNPEFGKVTPWYPGWGEELYLAYRTIQKNEPVHRGETYRLYYNFPAALIRPARNCITSAMPEGHGKVPYRYGEHDYYIISRNGVSAYTYIPFPEGIEPMFTLADRKFVKAWVFRGSDLKKAGFAF